MPRGDRLLLGRLLCELRLSGIVPHPDWHPVWSGDVCLENPFPKLHGNA